MTLWDIGVASFCLTSSAYLYLLRHQQNSSLVSTGLPSTAYILTNQVIHARLRPLESKHAFSYQTMSLLLSLSALESQALNCGWWGVIFGYPGIWGRMTGIRPQAYLKDQIGPGAFSPSIREKLADLLRKSNMKLGEVWMMTIHAYILQVGKNEDEKDEKSKGYVTNYQNQTFTEHIAIRYDHQWTFARQFHVSPFNDRSGHYVCSVVVPSHPPPVISFSPKFTTSPRPVIRLHLVTAPPSPEVKLVALLRPTISEPLTATNLLASLALPPRRSQSSGSHLLTAIPEPSPAPWSALPFGATLLLTSLRIIYQAALLHYQRGLAVFARPEPVAGPGREWVEHALGGVWNDVQPSDGDRIVTGGSIGWQSESSTERWARERFETRMHTIGTKLRIKLRIASTNPLDPVILLGSQESHVRELVLCYRSPRTWTAILIAPTATHALEVGSRAEHWFGVSDESLFKELWDEGSSLDGQSQIAKIVGLMRTHLAYLPNTAKTSLTLPQPPYTSHPLDSPPSFSLLAHGEVCYRGYAMEGLGKSRPESESRSRWCWQPNRMKLVDLQVSSGGASGNNQESAWGSRPQTYVQIFLWYKKDKMMFTLVVMLWLAGATLGWVIPNIDLPTYTYQCMPMELNWYDGSPPYSIWFGYSRGGPNGAKPTLGLGAWFNLTGHNFVVSCIAPAGSTLMLMLQDSTGWISMSRASGHTHNLAGLSEVILEANKIAHSTKCPFQSQGALSTSLQQFRSSVISAITASAISPTSGVIITSVVASTADPTGEATATASPISGSKSLGRILGPILASLFAVLLCLVVGICLIRRRRKRKQEGHIPLVSTSAFDLLDGEGARPTRPRVIVQEIHELRAEPNVMNPANTTTNANATRVVPRNQLRLHNGTAPNWPSTVKNRESAVPPVPEATEQAPPTPTTQAQDQRTLEQRAEQLSPPELERLAALVARRLERVRGAPPQYQATEGIGV
ncbi:hypothetical protein AG1IA_08594 [Rhizoctonia solani AG-1 IA]|uniref:Transmembrane protein n=1 Tax=Thanatephorus cucumeris (strain AG1-IA) TaxID=983506 RepID=L8WM12_THACA|nr:hypothetical protein AG1IA_08594 [Rhizoctonia solani AG-1 IA]